MSERDQILIGLVKEVLGPRNGPMELLPEEKDPRNEYITGVLEPITTQPEQEIEDEIDEVIEETSGEEDQDNQGFVAASGVFSPALNPKSLPRSIGLSFSISSSSINEPPKIEVCATWARYQQLQHSWQRVPEYFLTGLVQGDQNPQSWTVGPGIILQMRSMLLPNGARRISLFLVNNTPASQNDRPSTPDFLFQPQIRVHCCPGTYLTPVRLSTHENPERVEPGSMAEEDLRLGLLYLQRTAYARGHMCGATWKDIDPERPCPGKETPIEAPFSWTDKDLLPKEEQQKFTPADVRTELVPCYPIQTPGMAWDPAFGSEPQLVPETLSEVWQPDQLIIALTPLLNGYRTWINAQEILIPELPTSYQLVANRNLDQCRLVADRIEEAIHILVADEEVRLAFCFANKVIALQAQWKGQILRWRPFQLAFILLNIPALSSPFHPDRQICDLLWFPTGGGKTESYLGLAAFELALRRLRARQNDFGQDQSGGGTGVLSRYTLRLLTIQQFRRTLGVITACELLRVMHLNHPGVPVGWRPRECTNLEDFLWGGARFSVGLWVGGGVTPNNLLSIGPIPTQNGGFTLYGGALDILQGLSSSGYSGPNQALKQKALQASHHLEVEGEPAQVLNCPCCRSILAVPDEGLEAGSHTLHFVYEGNSLTNPNIAFLQYPSISKLIINSANITHHNNQGYHTLSLTITIPAPLVITAAQIDEWWDIIAPKLGQNVMLISARPARPGYFILTYDNSQNASKQCDFNIYCPNPACELNQNAWAEQVPLPRDIANAGGGLLNQMPLGLLATTQTNHLPLSVNGGSWQIVPSSFRIDDTEAGERISTRIPIPAQTVDDQIYQRCPSMVIATVDKFARLAFEPRAASLFGNVTHYHSRWGYYREGCPPAHDGTLPSSFKPHPPGKSKTNTLNITVFPFSPPDLILQDELHLIEGPLGSMVGLYEIAVDTLCQRVIDGKTIKPKYISSTATVRQAETQVQSLFDRQLVQFPPSAISADQRFFATDQEIHPLDDSKPGRLYVAVCAPGKGAQTPIVRLWSGLLQNIYNLSQMTPLPKVDPFWTLVGYFNATRELAGALALYRQDIPERMAFRTGSQGQTRPLDDAKRIELSSRASSLRLPILLQKLELIMPSALDAVLATSMFGTGVDVDRLSLMVVHGQPKTTASYIQATGRVGRRTSGLVITFFRASRPRDLDHYEFFTGYHRALYRYVEPITVAPFSPRARERAIGPLSVAMLRQAIELIGVPVNNEWRVQQRLSGAYYSFAYRMSDHRHDSEVDALRVIFESRANQQPLGRRPLPGITSTETDSELDRWHSLASQHRSTNEFVYNESAMVKLPQRHVVLGDSQHHLQFDEAYENTPQSLRDVEETTGFRT